MRIDPQNPEATTLSKQPFNAETLEELLEAAFPLNTDDAVLYWNGIPVPISYKYDLPVMLDEIEELIQVVTYCNGNESSIQWPSNTFRANWRLRRIGDRVKIAAEWEAVAHNREVALNACHEAEVDATEFLEHWQKLLIAARAALLKAGYSKAGCPEWDRLDAMIASCHT